MEVIIKAGNGKEVKFLVRDEKEQIQSHWAHGNFYEAQRNGLLSYIGRNGYSGRCLDIGASIGNHALYFHCILGCEVIAFEPAKESFDHLKVNCWLNNAKIELHNIALGAKKHRVSMVNKSKKRFNIGMMQVTEGDDVEMDLLDNVVTGQFSFIKIDVEHFNVPLLKGARETLTKQQNCHVFIECETKRMRGYTDEIMREYGYRMADIKLNHTPTYLWTK